MPGWKLLSDNKQWDLHTEKEGLVCDSNRVLSKGTENEMVFDKKQQVVFIHDSNVWCCRPADQARLVTVSGSPFLPQGSTRR